MGKNEKRKLFSALIVIALCLPSLGWDVEQKLGSLEESEKVQTTAKKDYKFTTDWVSVNIPWWDKILARFKGKANIHYLEIGVYEGRATVWMLENILTHPSAKATAVDLFPESRMETHNYRKTFFANIRLSGFEGKVTTLIGMSQIEMRTLPIDSFDIIYIDGSHTADDVLADAVLAWPLLRNDGIIIFDDYNLELDFPVELRPRFAIESFITAYRNFLDIILLNRQVFLKKRKPLFEDWRGKFYVPIGQYAYSWRDKQLYLADTREPVNFVLSDKEIELIEQYLKSRNYLDRFLIPSDNNILKDEAFVALRRKLKLNLYFRQKN